MNVIGQIDPSAFAAAQRLHHREDEQALEFPSSVSSRARGLLGLRAINWAAMAKGDDMTTITCDTRCATIADVVNWLTSLGYSYADNKIFVHKDHKYNIGSELLAVARSYNGQAYWAGLRTTSSGSAQAFAMNASGPAVIEAGSVFYVI